MASATDVITYIGGIGRSSNHLHSGLWVPIGTALLVSPDREENVLTIAPLDDSDGKLSLVVRWSSDWRIRINQVFRHIG
jgi:hypothetical protein